MSCKALYLYAIACCVIAFAKLSKRMSAAFATWGACYHVNAEMYDMLLCHLKKPPWWPGMWEIPGSLPSYVQRRNVTTSMVGLKNGHIHTNFTPNGEPQRYSWGTQKKKKKNCPLSSRLSHSSDLEICTLVAGLPGTWHYRVSSRTSWLKWPDETGSLICIFCLSHRLVGLVIKASASGAEDPGFKSACDGTFPSRVIPAT